jgi:hypothetical protein
VVIDDLNFKGIATAPDEADSPLVIDPKAVLSEAIASELLQMVSRRNPQVPERLSVVEHCQLAARDILDAPEARASPAVEKGFRLSASECPYHHGIL